MGTASHSPPTKDSGPSIKSLGNNSKVEKDTIPISTDCGEWGDSFQLTASLTNCSVSASDRSIVSVCLMPVGQMEVLKSDSHIPAVTWELLDFCMVPGMVNKHMRPVLGLCLTFALSGCEGKSPIHMGRRHITSS